MKFIKWRTLIVTSIVCILPILLGVALWDRLPENVAIHFNLNNEPDNFAPKGFVVFGLPCLMVLLQAISCIITDINAKKHGDCKKVEFVTKWIVPVMTIFLYIATLVYALGRNIDMRQVAVLILGIVFIVMGNYMPKLDYIKNYNIDTQKARRINRFVGYESVIMGILAILTIFLPPFCSVVWIALLIPYMAIGIIYMEKVRKEK